MRRAVDNDGEGSPVTPVERNAHGAGGAVPAPAGSNYHVRGTLRGGVTLELPTDEGHEWIALSRREAGRLRDMAAIRADLEAARGVLVDLIADLEATGAPPSLPSRTGDDYRARYEGAVNGYARCFVDGRREQLRESLFHDEQADDHAYFIGLRHKHHAHSVSNMEAITAAVGVPPDGSGAAWRLQEIVFAHQVDVPAKLARLVGLIDVALAHVDELCKAEHDRIRAWLTPEVKAQLRQRKRMAPIGLERRDLAERKPSIRA